MISKWLNASTGSDAVAWTIVDDSRHIAKEK
jgi:hypothetical protein